MRDDFPRIRRIEINFPERVELLPGTVESLVSSIENICQNFNAKHATKVMWHSGGGFKPVWSAGDIVNFIEDIFEFNISMKEEP